jgi:hypothetical protein
MYGAATVTRVVAWMAVALVGLSCTSESPAARSSERPETQTGAVAGPAVRIDSATALRAARRAIIALPWSDSLIVRSFAATPDGYEFELVFPEPAPLPPAGAAKYELVTIGGGVVFVRRDGGVQVVQRYQ